MLERWNRALRCMFGLSAERDHVDQLLMPLSQVGIYVVAALEHACLIEWGRGRRGLNSASSGCGSGAGDARRGASRAMQVVGRSGP